MMPKLIALARRRTSASMPSTGTPNISEAVIAWMSMPSAKACFSCGMSATWASTRSSIWRVVGRDELGARRRDEGGADLAALLGADRDVLQVRLGGGEPARRRRRQRIGGVHPAGLRVHIARQRVGIGRFQLGELPPFDDPARQLDGPARRGPPECRPMVAHWPVAVFLPPGRPITPNRMSPSCFGEPTLKGWPASSWISASSRAGALRELAGQPRQDLAVDHDAGASPCRASTATSGRSSVS